MVETLKLFLAFIAGFALGALFFAGLWLTVKKATASSKPSIIVLGSFVVRMAIVVLGFYFIGAGSWQRLLVALLGFIVARYLIIYLTKAPQAAVKKEVNHEA